MVARRSFWFGSESITGCWTGFDEYLTEDLLEVFN